MIDSGAARHDGWHQTSLRLQFADAAFLSIKLLKRGELKMYKGLGHGLCTINLDVVNPDLLEFIKA